MTVEPRTYQAPASIGACMAALAIEDAVAVLHGGAGCDIKLHTLLRHHNATGDVHRHVVCTKISQADLVLDPGRLLGRTVSGIVARVGANLAVISSASFVEVAGLDREALQAELDRSVSVPSVYVYAPDFAGDLFDGYSRALAAIAQRFSRGARPSRPTARRANLVGYFLDRPYAEHRANLAEVQSLLARLELALNVTLLDGSPAARLNELADAELSLVLPGGGPAAAVLSETLGHRAVDVPLPMGLKGTRDFLARVGEAVGRLHEAERIASEGEARVSRLLRQIADPLVGRRVAVFADGEKAGGLLSMCRDMRMVPVLAGVLDRRPGSVEGQQLDGIELLVDPGQPTTANAMREVASSRGIDLVIGPAQEVRMARRLGIAALEFGFPCREWQPLYPSPYLGYEGILAVASRALEVVLQADERDGR